MRADFSKALENLFDKEDRHVFLTGDLGFMAFENIRAKFGQRFINAGVAEQNMVSVAAGMAKEGLIPWVYNIAPFAVLRPYEQIRNDVCLHNLPVKIVGNGGGYGYGIMGATHHTLEDLAVMRVLPNMKIYVPMISADVNEAVTLMSRDGSPNYLRLNLGAKLPFKIGPFSAFRKIKSGKKAVMIGTGPVTGNILSADDPDILDDLEIWSVGLLPLEKMPEELLGAIKDKRKVISVEEHSGQCGLNEALARSIIGSIGTGMDFTSISACGYPEGRMGSQLWHQQQSGLAGQTLVKALKGALNNGKT